MHEFEGTATFTHHFGIHLREYDPFAPICCLRPHKSCAQAPPKQSVEDLLHHFYDYYGIEESQELLCCYSHKSPPHRPWMSTHGHTSTRCASPGHLHESSLHTTRAKDSSNPSVSSIIPLDSVASSSPGVEQGLKMFQSPPL